MNFYFIVGKCFPYICLWDIGALEMTGNSLIGQVIAQGLSTGDNRKDEKNDDLVH
jgi:hypothetical protein